MSGHIGFIFSTATFSAKVLPACTAGEKAVACPLCTASYHVTQHSCQKAKVTVAHIRCLLDFLHDLEFSMLFNLNCMIVGRLVRRYDDLPIMRGLKEQVESDRTVDTDRSADNILAFNFPKNDRPADSFFAFNFLKILANLAKSSKSGATAALKNAFPVHKICSKRQVTKTR